MPYAAAIQLKKYPFVRLVAALIAGILLQWYLQFTIAALLVVLCCTALATGLFALLPASVTFNIQWVRGLVVLLLVGITGSIAVYVKDIRNNPQYIGNYYHLKQQVLVTIDEPLVDKPNSYKALATVTAIQQGGVWKKTTGDVLLYFYKGKQNPKLQYGSQIILHADLQPIKNSGNPGAFDYKQYCLFHDIGYQSFVYPGQYTNIFSDGANSVQQALYNLRDATIASLQKTIPGEKEQAVAEALLIGYRDKLDPDLVQAYTNTGVVHIIAISGMHLGMIYLLLLAIFSRLPANKANRIIEAIVVITVLWLFSLLAGAAPSITRAAVMFTVVALGKVIDRKAGTYNTLAASAFILLVYNPFYLWDAGFMLSYSAVLSIVAFYKPVYNWFYVKNKLLGIVWKATAVSIAAQILTLPVILLYFHQFPATFLIANLIAVPLSEFILYGELALILVIFIPFLAKWIGVAVYYMLVALDGFIQHISNLPFVLWDNIYADVAQTILLYAFILAACYWLLQKASKGFIAAMLFLSVLIAYTGIRYINIYHTQKLVVYNVPHQTAIDIMQGSSYHFIGDSILLQDDKLQRYNLKPCRIMNGVSASTDASIQPNIKSSCIAVNRTKILFLDSSFSFNNVVEKTPVDVIVLSKNPKCTIFDVQKAFAFKKLVFDSSNPMWKIRRWKKDCDSLHLRFHSVQESGAFQLDL